MSFLTATCLLNDFVSELTNCMNMLQPTNGLSLTLTSFFCMISCIWLSLHAWKMESSSNFKRWPHDHVGCRLGDLEGKRRCFRVSWAYSMFRDDDCNVNFGDWSSDYRKNTLVVTCKKRTKWALIYMAIKSKRRCLGKPIPSDVDNTWTNDITAWISALKDLIRWHIRPCNSILS